MNKIYKYKNISFDKAYNIIHNFISNNEYTTLYYNNINNIKIYDFDRTDNIVYANIISNECKIKASMVNLVFQRFNTEGYVSRKYKSSTSCYYYFSEKGIEHFKFNNKFKNITENIIIPQSSVLTVLTDEQKYNYIMNHKYMYIYYNDDNEWVCFSKFVDIINYIYKQFNNTNDINQLDKLYYKLINKKIKINRCKYENDNWTVLEEKNIFLRQVDKKFSECYKKQRKQLLTNNIKHML